jgi:hypothetical protein
MRRKAHELCVGDVFRMHVFGQAMPRQGSSSGFKYGRVSARWRG